MIRIRSLTLYGSLLLLTACGGESYKSSPLQSELFQRSCIDSNNNSRCEQAELDNFAEAADNNKSIIVPVNSSHNQVSATRLLETVNSLTGEQTLVLKAPVSSLQTDALTTLLWHEIYFNPLVSSELDAKNYLTKKLGINWSQGNIVTAVYEQQEIIAREHIINAQAENTPSIAITAVIESMIKNRTLDSAADFSLVQNQQIPLALSGHYQSSSPIISWNYNSDQQELALAHPKRKIEILTLSNAGQLRQAKELSISSGPEAAIISTAKKPTKTLATSTVSIQGIDAFASATTTAPAPAPAPTPAPTPTPTPPTNPDTPANEARNLIPNGEIVALHFNSDNRTGLFLTYDSAQSQPAERACNQNILTYGLFKFDHYLSVNDKTPVIAACSQQSLSRIVISKNGDSALAWDQVARRLYSINTQSMLEASRYYLQLNSSLLTMKLNHAADYAFIAEEQGRRSYIVRIADMQVMIDFSFAGNQISDAQWLANGNNLFITSENEWQLWDTRLTYNPKLLDSGSLPGSGKLRINQDASLIARINNNELFIYRISDNQLLAQDNNIQSIQWNGNQILAQENKLIKILTLQPLVTNPIQAASALLTDSYVAADNSSLNNITQKLNLPNNVGELSLSEQGNFKDLEIIWSITPELENSLIYHGNNQGSISQSPLNRQGVLTATITGYFRGDAVRWKKQFNLTIPALP